MVLIVEDDRDVSTLLERLLTRVGYSVSTAPDGTTAFRLATTSRPDAVVTDLDMPGMTGLELCEAIRTDPVLHDVPVAILSGSLTPGDPRPAAVRACGAWPKPFTSTELVAAVKALLAAGRHEHHGVSSACPLGVAARI
jgi:CheY-like chemotaxis protein